MAPSADHEPEPPETGGAPVERRAPASIVAPALRTIARPVKLVVTALAIVLALALGIPWLISLVW